MGVVVLLGPAGPGEVVLGPAAMASLARLGVTSVALVRDEETVGLVLEGWAFDAWRAGEAAAAVAPAGWPLRTLRPLVQMAVSTAPTRGGSDEKEARTGAGGDVAARAG
jgi:hypothetical protein